MNLLIINDEIVTADAMRRKINWKEYGIDDVYLAFDAEEAQKQMQENDVDIMLCDIEMPGKNGIELLHWVREQNIECDCIFLTCHANFAYAQEAVKLGCMDYVLLPSRYEDIGAAVQKVVTRKNEKKDLEKLQQYGEQWVNEKKVSAIEIQGGKKTRVFLQECEEYIMNHLEEEDMSVNNLAEKYHLNAIYMNRLFKQEKNISISQFIIKERMELAARLLKGGELSATIVAVRVGYPNYPHFSSTFKKYFGCSPKQYGK